MDDQAAAALPIDEPEVTEPRRLSIRVRRFVFALLAVGLGFGSGVLLVLYSPENAEKVANGLRDVLGPRFVAFLEDTFYGARDQVLLRTQGRGSPAIYWRAEPTPEAEGSPPPLTPPHPEVAASDDGRWTAVHDDLVPREPMIWKTQIHPDPARGRAVVAVFAIDAARARLHLFAGTREPDVPAPRRERPGMVPAEMHASLVAIWSGGFRSVNGKFGMRVGTRTFHHPHYNACTVAMVDDGTVRVGPWVRLRADNARFVAIRQGPSCLVADGELGRYVHDDRSHTWGVSVDGSTIIRRSGFGTSADGRTWYYALGDELTTQALARTMRLAGAANAALLDVNVAPVRLLFYRRGAAGLEVSSYMPGSRVVDGMYITRPWERDFFALTRIVP